MEKVKVSFILPVYNVEKYLRRCIDSLLNQTLKEIEIICVHDGSSDGSLAILKEYATRHSHIHIIDKENEGAYKARVDGIGYAKGEYIGFVDPDDYVADEFAEKLYRKAKESNADIVCCGFERIDEITGKVYSREMDQHGKKTIHMNKNPEALLSVNTAVWNKLYKAELLRNLELFDKIKPVILDDCNLLMIIYLNVKSISFIDDILYYYIVRQGGIIMSIDKKKIEGAESSMMQIKKMYEKHSDYSIIEVIDLMAFLHLGINLMFFVSSSDPDFKETLNKNKAFLDRNFPLWKTSRYLRLSYTIKHGFNQKIAVVRLIYKLHLFRAFLVLYRWMIRKLHIDIKW